MRWRVLGAIEAVDDRGQAVPIGSPNQRVVLAMLLAHRGEVVGFDALCEAVWGAEPPASAVTSLRTYVSRLRHLAGADLVTRGAGYALALGPDDLDAARFDALVARAGAAPPADAVAHLREALDLWRGPAFGAEAHLPGVRGEAVRLEERRGAARQALAAALLAADRADECIAEAEALVADEPFREGAWVVLVDALGHAGRAVDALRAVQRGATALAEAGLEPSLLLRDAEQRVLANEALPARVAADARRAAPFALAPHRASSFVGRSAEVEGLTDLLTSVRLVTLVGPGGVGKSRLAAEVLHAGVPGTLVRWVPLGDLDDSHDSHDSLDSLDRGAGSTASALAAMMLTAAGRTTDGVDARAVVGSLGELDLLLALDGAEHVVDAVAEAVEAVLRGGVRARVLVTSREPLELDGEHVWPVDPLPTTWAGAAVQLFSERARAVAPRLDLASRTATVQSIVARLDGLPLGIEMAAARLAVTSLDELAGELERSLAELDAGARRGVAAHHRSLATVLARSERSLRPDDRAVLDAMTVFAGPVAGRDLAGVLGDDAAPARARELARRSLVTVDTSATTTRFGLLNVVRAHVSAQLDRDRRAALAERHAAWFTAVAGHVDETLRRGDDDLAAARLDDALAELRAAHRWTRTNDPAAAATISSRLYASARARMLDELLTWADALLAAGGNDAGVTDETVGALASSAARAIARGELAVAAARARRATASPDPLDRLAAFEVLGDALLFAGDLDGALAAYGDLAAGALERSEWYWWTVATVGGALVHLYAGRHNEAAALVDDAASCPGRLGATAQAWIEYAQGEVLAVRDDPAALVHYERAATLAGAVGSRYPERMALVASSALAARVGDIAMAVSRFERIIETWLETGERTHHLTTLRNLAVLLRRAERAEAVAVLVGALRDAPVEAYGDEARRLDEAWAWAVDRLGEARAGELGTQRCDDEVAALGTWALGELQRWREGS